MAVRSAAKLLLANQSNPSGVFPHTSSGTKYPSHVIRIMKGGLVLVVLLHYDSLTVYHINTVVLNR